MVLALCTMIGFGIVASRAVDQTDPAMLIEHSDLYRQDLVEVPLADGAVATQRVEAAGLTRVDVLVRATDGDARLRLRVYDEDAELIRSVIKLVQPSDTPEFLPIIFDIIPAEMEELVLRLDSPSGDAAPSIYGSTCECLRGGDFTFGKGTGTAAPALEDLHLGTYTVGSRGERAAIVADRIDAYAPGWLSTSILVVALGLGAFAMAVLTAIAYARSCPRASQPHCGWAVGTVAIPLAAAWVMASVA